MDVTNMPRTRQLAKELGAPYYFTGIPCTRGHVAPRKTKGVCIECMREDWVVDNARRALKPKTDAAKAAGKRYYEKNREIVIARAAARPPEEKRAARNKYKENNLDAVRVDTNARRRRHREATPAWLTDEQRATMKKMYVTARNLTKLTGVQYVVDHIVPLRSDVVCGLHVPWNLQVITQEENLRKSNALLTLA